MNEITFTDAVPVDGYGPGFFRVGGKIVSGAVCLSALGTREWGGLDDPDTLLSIGAEADVLFIGTGAEISHICPKLRDRLEGSGLGVEVMNSPAACRTYNVLLSEGRRVALAVIPV